MQPSSSLSQSSNITKGHNFGKLGNWLTFDLVVDGDPGEQVDAEEEVDDVHLGGELDALTVFLYFELAEPVEQRYDQVFGHGTHSELRGDTLFEVSEAHSRCK